MYLQHKLRLLTNACAGNTGLQRKRLLQDVQDFTLDEIAGHKCATLLVMSSSRDVSK